MTDSLRSGEKSGAAENLRKKLRGKYREDDFKGLVSDEYRMLQDKIDKIGEFRFTIKGWSVTAVIAGTITTSGKGLAIACAISSGLLAMILFFLLLEYEQVKHSRLYGERAARLEDVFRRIAYGKGEDMFRSVPVPYTAHDLVLAALQKKAKGRRGNSEERKGAGLWRVVGTLHVWFYIVLMVLSMGPLAAQHKQVAETFESFQRISHGAEKQQPSAHAPAPKGSPSGK